MQTRVCRITLIIGQDTAQQKSTGQYTIGQDNTEKKEATQDFSCVANHKGLTL